MKPRLTLELQDVVYNDGPKGWGEVTPIWGRGGSGLAMSYSKKYLWYWEDGISVRIETLELLNVLQEHIKNLRTNGPQIREGVEL